MVCRVRKKPAFPKLPIPIRRACIGFLKFPKVSIYFWLIRYKSLSLLLEIYLCMMDLN